MENYAYINGILVRSRYNFIVYGSVRGLVSQHKTYASAIKSMEKDKRACRKQHGYSDVYVYEFKDKWVKTDFV